MIIIRKSDDRGLTSLAWLKSFHTFSFGYYYDPQFMGFGNLRVINEDTVAPGQGFDMHEHRDMEIITYIVSGALEHKDSMGTGSIIKPGEIQKMSAGTGVSHSEFNPSTSDPVHLLQIWIIPREARLKPNYEQQSILQKPDQWILIGSSEGKNGAVTINQDVNLYVAYLKKEATVTHTLAANHSAWIQLIKGKIDLNHQVLTAGDGAAIRDENLISVHCLEEAELLLFDLK